MVGSIHEKKPFGAPIYKEYTLVGGERGEGGGGGDEQGVQGRRGSGECVHPSVVDAPSERWLRNGVWCMKSRALTYHSYL